MAELEDINGVGPARSESLKEAGYESPEDLVDADPEDVAEHAGISEDNALETIVQAQNMVEDDETQDDVEAENEAEPEAETISDEIDQELDAEPQQAVEEVEETSDEQTAEPERIDEEEAEPREQEPEAAPQDEDEDEDGRQPTGEETLEDRGGETVEEGVDEEAVEEAEAEEEAAEGPFNVTLDFDSREHFDVFHAALVEHWQDSYDTRVDSSLMRNILDSMDDFESVDMELSREELNSLHSALHQERVSYQGSNQVEQLNLLRDMEQDVNGVRQEELF